MKSSKLHTSLVDRSDYSQVFQGQKIMQRTHYANLLLQSYHDEKTMTLKPLLGHRKPEAGHPSSQLTNNEYFQMKKHDTQIY